MKSLYIWLLITPIAIIATIVIILLATEWHPEPQETISHIPYSQTTPLPDSLTVVSWNIGYAGLGDDMDFFYEGGEKTRTSQQRTEQNLDEIISWLKSVDGTDFILLQEVDRNSKRSYYIDQYLRITEALPHYYAAWAYNYISPYVPIPIRDPMGRVEAGIMTLSKYPIARSIRYQYPSIKALPTRLFDLKRCMLTCQIQLPNGQILSINNTHNSAFNTAESRSNEITHIYEILSSQKLSITSGDWNATPPKYTPSPEALNDPYFQPIPLDHSDIPPHHTVAYDPKTPSMRYLDKAYDPHTSTHCIVDFAVVNNYFQITDYETINLYFKNSDHNPSRLIVKKEQ